MCKDHVEIHQQCGLQPLHQGVLSIADLIVRYDGVTVTCVMRLCDRQILALMHVLTNARVRAVYMAPEVFQREYGLEADMWSLGMMLYQCMTCRFPFWTSIEACRQKSLDEVARAVILDDITLNFGPWLSMSPEVSTSLPYSLGLAVTLIIACLNPAAWTDWSVYGLLLIAHKRNRPGL